MVLTTSHLPSRLMPSLIKQRKVLSLSSFYRLLELNVFLKLPELTSKHSTHCQRSLHTPHYTLTALRLLLAMRQILDPYCPRFSQISRVRARWAARCAFLSSCSGRRSIPFCPDLGRNRERNEKKQQAKQSRSSTCCNILPSWETRTHSTPLPKFLWCV
jgi:hypothetical protein